jgi:hypothetical protein
MRRPVLETTLEPSKINLGRGIAKAMDGYGYPEMLLPTLGRRYVEHLGQGLKTNYWMLKYVFRRKDNSGGSQLNSTGLY